jgi:hypothetical protein
LLDSRSLPPKGGSHASSKSKTTPPGYSCLNATIGSTPAARRAGM